MTQDTQLAQARETALRLEENLNAIVLGQARAVRLLLIAVHARGHALLEGDVGIGKTTLLRGLTRGLGGESGRIEGSMDMMPTDLIYHTQLDSQGKPRVEPGPLLRHGESLATFFFNEINRARPQVHAQLLRVMAERAVGAFNREFRFPHLLVFADRNRVEKEETFELPAAARDRFMMEIPLEYPADDTSLEAVMFDPRFHDTDALVAEVTPGILPYAGLNALGARLQQAVNASPRLRAYVLDLWKASHHPADYGVQLPDADGIPPVQVGASPRGMSLLIRAARVHAWLAGRTSVLPEDVQAVFPSVIGHRLTLDPMLEYRRAALVPVLVNKLLNAVAAP
ncbi:MoxR family ATPase [Methylococcus sp. EFPC2]|uniref:AAA family ATPase n=1 Tax=Methylococcus sp. EFPC2 TaxID=2812648 RepID=UPI001967DE95|nr:MoxR family ATPase [Methylococcus sp. EFPC2]QSA97374.1 MoxR family ATPase [Methylococcus sp. EFPC2]